MAEQPLTTASLLVHHRVEDFDTWRPKFEGNQGIREANGIRAHRINRSVDDPDDVRVYLAVEDVDRVKAFVRSDELKEIMKDVGIVGQPELTWATPKRFEVVWEGEYPAFILTHRVSDFDRWLEGYDDADEFRRDLGIIGHAANQLMDDHSMAIVYHQAESFDDLEAFLDEPELKEVMENAGVISEPEVVFVTGGWAKRY